jgi:hypothetical protein
VSWTPPSVSNTLSKCHKTIPRRASGLVQIAESLIVCAPVLETRIGLLLQTENVADALDYETKVVPKNIF